MINRYKYYCALFVLLTFTSCLKKVTYLADTDSSLYRIDKKVKATDPALDAMIAPYKEKLDALMNEVLAYNEEELFKDKPSSPLTNWFADSFMEGAEQSTGKDLAFAVQNYGGIRLASMGKGDVTIGKIYELMPFDNLLAIVSTDSLGVQMLCDRIANYGGWPVSRELHFDIQDSLARNITIDSKLLDGKSHYLIALPDYVANGGDNCFFLKDYNATMTEFLIRDLVIEAVKKQKVIKLNNEARIKTIKNGK